jgi:RNA polymerase sigma factor (TIGR02999 family)
MTDPLSITALVREAAAGNRAALDQLLPLVYEELHTLAHRRRASWQDAAAPGTTSLVHEAYLRLAHLGRIEAGGKSQFFALASRVLRSVLVDNARRLSRRKRGRDPKPLPLDESLLVAEDRADDVVGLDEALGRLEASEPRLARVVECRFFGGLTVEETAEALGVSPATVKRDWAMAKGWLFAELQVMG